MRNFTIPVYLVVLTVVVVGCDNEDGMVNNNNSQIVANDFLSDKKYDKLIVEIQYANGYAPTATALNNLQTFLQQRLNKPAGITLTQNAIPSPGKAVYSADDIRNLEKSNRTQHPSDKTLTAYFFFADADYAANDGNSKVLGIAYGPSSMAIFEKTIKDFSGGVAQPATSTLESAVMLHEFSHILGLVNNGTGMTVNHQDEPHGKHCNDQNCLMYYATETTDIVANLVGGNIPELNSACIDDLRANGGK